MTEADKGKVSLWVPPDMFVEVCAEAKRQERSRSWIIQLAWRIARERIRKMPGKDDRRGADDSVGSV